MRQAPDCCARGGFPFIAFLVELLPLVHWSWGLLGDKWAFVELSSPSWPKHLTSGRAGVKQTLGWGREARAAPQVASGGVQVFLMVEAGLGNGFSVVSPALSSWCDVQCPPRSYECLDSCTAIATLPFSAP